MPTWEWLKREFSYGYSSGNILSWFPGWRRFSDERKSGGSYKRTFYKAIFPNIRPDSRVLELGPGRGSWSRAMLKYLPQGELHVVDFQKVDEWLQPQSYGSRLKCHQVTDSLQ